MKHTFIKSIFRKLRPEEEPVAIDNANVTSIEEYVANKEAMKEAAITIQPYYSDEDYKYDDTTGYDTIPYIKEIDESDYALWLQRKDNKDLIVLPIDR